MSTLSASARVAAALLASDPAYVQKTLDQRNPGPKAVGSVFDEPQTAESLAAAEWVVSDDPGVVAPAVGFRAPIPGTVGLVELAKLDPSTACVVKPTHGGAAAFVAAFVKRDAVPAETVKVGYTTLMVGPKDKDNGDLTEVLWTFHPGAAVRPSTMAPSAETEAVTTVEQAIALGFGLAKVEN